MSTKRIVRLNEETINRIAAGEIVQRPAAVVKELIENCLDAGSTSISVTCKGGGLDFLQIQDNGHGIEKESLNIVCERFTTSKITSFEDLNTVATFGFRGEALASITHVAQVTITTMTAGQKCAFKAKYLDGKLVPLRPGDKPDPKPCAGVVGTIIVVEDLFYNMATRRQAFKNPQEEFQRILDVMTRHAIQFPLVSFICKKADKGSGAASLQSNQNSTTLDNIRLIYGPAVARELLDFKVTSSASRATSATTLADAAHDEADIPEFRVDGYISNANYSCKKSTFVVFINNRLVTSLAIQRCVEAVYKQYLPKHTHPFVYLSVCMPPQHVDVNVHPTKKEVHFLFETELLGLLHESMTKKLEGANDSRVFFTQSLLTTAVPSLAVMPGNTQRGEETASESPSASKKANTLASLDAKTDYERKPTPSDKAVRRGSSSSSSSSGGGGGSSTSIAANKFVRTDPSLQSIDHFFPRAASRGEAQTWQVTSSDGSVQADDPVFCMLCNDVGGISSTSGSGGADGEANMSSGLPGCCCCPSPAGSVSIGAERVGSLKRKIDGSSAAASQSNEGGESAAGGGGRKLPQYQLTPYDYSSLQGLLQEIDAHNDASLQGLLRRHTLVGVVDDVHLLVQSGTQLILVDHSVLTFHLFRQLSLRRFGVMSPLVLTQPVDVKKFIVHALDSEEGQWDEASQGGAKEKAEVATALCALLASKGDMLREYFQIGFSTDFDTLFLVSMPELLAGHRPQPETLSLLLLRLGVEVDWEEEKACFEGVSRELALCYCALPTICSEEEGNCVSSLSVAEKGTSASTNGEVGPIANGESDEVRASALARYGRDLLPPAAKSLLLHTLIPALKAYLSPPKELATDGSFVVIAALDQLYKVFERC